MPTPSQFTKASASSLRRGLAFVAAGLVFALTIFAATPRLHEWLHASGADHAGDQCAVVLLAAGVTLAVADVSVAALPLLVRAPRTIFGQSVVLVRQRYRLQPERGPPAA